MKWRRDSADAGVPWVVYVDEPQRIELDPNSLRRGRTDYMWPFLMGGAGGFEWHVWQDGGGPGDPLADDVRRFEGILLWSGHLLGFFQEIPYWEMESDRGKVRNRDGYLLENPDDVYAVYPPGGDAVDVDLASGTYDVRWFDLENGNFCDGGSVSGGTATDLPSPPFAGDAAAIIERI